MRWASSLYTRSLCMLAMYFLSLGVFAFLLLNAHFGVGWDALINSPAGDRIDTVGDSVAATLRSIDRSKWNTALHDLGERYGCEFFLFSEMNNEQQAGRPIQLPADLAAKLVSHPFGPPMHLHGHGEHHRRFDPPHFEPPPGGIMGPPPKRTFRFGMQSGNYLWVGIGMLLTSPDDSNRPMPGVLLACMRNAWQSSLLFDFVFLAKVVGGLLAFSLLFWLPFVWRIVHQLSNLTHATEKIADGNFNVSLTAKGNDEVARLTNSINAMSQRLNTYVERQKFLLADISHELVTPIARLNMAVEVLDSTPDVDERAQLMNEIRDEITEMHLLIDELLAFTKSGIKGKDLELHACSLDELVHNACRRLPGSERVDIRVSEELMVMAEPTLLTRAISNVVRNSLRYAPDGAVSITAQRSTSGAVLVIEDRGPGVPPDILKYLCEPFYRPDSARSRASGGVGLGLAIVKTCVEACGGSVQISNVDEGGLRVTLRLVTPAAAAPLAAGIPSATAV